MYALPADGSDRLLDTLGVLENSITGFQRWLDGQTGGRSLRMDTSGGSLDITFFPLWLTEAEMLDKDPYIVREIERQLRHVGLVKPGKSHHRCGLIHRGGSRRPIPGVDDGLAPGRAVPV